ncbi:DNA methyltransferase, partial [Thermocrinis sp.]|uniref:Eco57I restriction-modification methylase domain-containing protein n=1 Tax=Thermocrinis sp. TaxID=2024383 RepID=UPI002FDDDD87
MSGLIKSITDISESKSISAISELFKQMGYKAKVIPLDKTQYELPPRANELIQEFSLICDYHKQFQVYFVKTPSMRRTDFRTIIEPFYRRFPHVNTLFIFTNDFSELAFVSPFRIPFDTTKIKILLRTLYLDPSSPYHTDLEVLEMIRINPNEQIPDIIWQKHKTAFDVERVTKEFFEAYKNALNFIRDEILIPQNKADYSKCHSFAQQLLSRIMFLYYLQKKGWLKWKDYVSDKRYIKNLWEKYKKYRNTPDSFYSEWLSPLFFSAFNKKHEYLKSHLPEEIKESFNLMPFLNGGLFTPNELDEIGFNLPDSVFELLFDIDQQDKNKGFLERFNFTVREDTPLEVEVAVDPEMLGKVYESLIAEEERQKAGIFYTPRVEIDLMCRLSLVEYLFEETKISKDDLISFIFEPEEIENYHNIEDLRKIKSALDSVKIVDPCVGSASFLVGMMNVLVEIHSHLTKKLEGREENLFALKQKIILENLYGVDVKDWAVMVGELRLWLSLIIETDEKYMDIYTKPLLPNLSFKMRQGDSLVEEIAGQKILLRKEFGIISPSLKNKIQELIDKKAQFFSGGRSADLKEKFEIERLENEIFKGLIENKISELDRKIQAKEKYLSSQQLEMYGTKAEKIKEEKERLKKELEQLKKEVQNLEEVKNALEKKTSKDYFFWEIDFAEVFAQKGGFDIVIGNPPYVRQEMIAYPLDREEEFSEDEWRERKREYKEKLVESVKSLWENVKIDKRSDLYVYFYYHGLSILKPGGIFCFINSNSWLDVGYGAGLQEFLLKNMKPIYVIDNIAQRTFEADINTVIVLIKRPKDKSEIKDDDVLKFVAFKKPFEEISRAEVFKQIEKEEKFTINEIYRVFPKKRIELLEEGVEIEEENEFKEPKYLPYIGNKWGGKYLRAPEIFFKILE